MAATSESEPSLTMPEPVVNLCRDEWSRWQQGGCGTYARALMKERPGLRLGGVDFWPEPGYDAPIHFVAHDDEYAYDSAGRHCLPYGGIEGNGKWLADIGEPEHWAEYGDPDSDALAHIRRHRILDGVYGTVPDNDRSGTDDA